MDDSVVKFCSKLKVPESFIFNLLHIDDDWTFLIKASFLIEGAVKRMAIESLGKTKLEGFIIKSDFEFSRLMLLDLDVISNETNLFIQKIMNLRNKLIHNLENHSFTFETYFRDKPSFASFFEVINPYIVDEVVIQGETVEKRTFIKENPKVGIVFGVFNLMSWGSLIVEKKEFEKIKIKFFEEMLSSRPGLKDLKK